MEKNSKKGTIIVIAIISALIITALVFFIFRLTSGATTTNDLVSIPKVKSSISSSDGESHYIEAKFVLSLTKGLGDAADKNGQLLNKRIADVIARLSYETLSAKDGTIYLKEAIKNDLSDTYTEEELEDLYLVGFASDFDLPQDTLPSASQSERFNGLFPNLK